jgi:hypothetical protein
MSSARQRCTCQFCVALQRYAVRCRAVAVIEVAERLSAEHLAADAEREAFTRTPVHRKRLGSAELCFCAPAPQTPR